MDGKYIDSNSFKITKILLFIFLGFIVCLDVFAFFIVNFFIDSFAITTNNIGLIALYSAIYTSSVAGLILIYNLYKVLINIENNQVFTKSNVHHLNHVSLACGYVSVITMFTGVFFTSVFFISIASGFVSLIVRIVMQIFVKAIAMKNEIELTI